MNPQWPNDFESLGRQYMEAWQHLMRGAMAAPGGVPGFGAAPSGFGAMGGMGPNSWQDPAQAWARTAAQFAQPEAMAALHRFNAQSNGWYAQMHELAAKFADQGATAKAIADEWRRMLEGNSGNVMADALRNMQSGGSQGFDAWYASVAPMLDHWKQEFSAWLNVPAFGLAREHQERLQKLMQAQIDYQEALNAHNALLANSGEAAMKHFEALLEKQGAAGKPITSARALFDTWVDAAEQAYAQVALSRDYRKAYADMVNAQMRLRGGVQREIEQVCDVLGMPTRTEMDAAHRKIAELERALRRQARSAAGTSGAAADATPGPAKPVAAKAKTAPAKRTSTKTTAKKPAAKKAAKPASRRRA